MISSLFSSLQHRFSALLLPVSQLAAASRDLMDREAEVKRKLVAAEERRAVAEEENERLRRELAAALRQRETEVKGNMNDLEAELKAFQGQASRRHASPEPQRPLLETGFQNFRTRLCES